MDQWFYSDEIRFRELSGDNITHCKVTVQYQSTFYICWILP